MDRKLQRHRADSLRQHGFLVIVMLPIITPAIIQYEKLKAASFLRIKRSVTLYSVLFGVIIFC